jgi:hypothetical protein
VAQRKYPKLAVYIDAEVHLALKFRSIELSRSISSLAEEALSSWLSPEAQKPAATMPTSQAEPAETQNVPPASHQSIAISICISYSKKDADTDEEVS